VPAEKKLKLDATSLPTKVLTASDKAELDLTIDYMKKSYNTDKWTVNAAVHMLEQTALYRQQWITEESPTVKEILEKFPCLKETQLVCSASVMPFLTLYKYFLDTEGILSYYKFKSRRNS